MFILDENQQHHLLVILNDINHHIYDSTIQSLKNNKNVNHPQKNYKKFDPSRQITGFNLSNRHNLIEFIFNAIRYFKTFFKFTSISSEPEFSPKSKHVIFWLSIFYRKSSFEHVNFDQIFNDGEFSSEKSKDFGANKNTAKLILNGAANNNNLLNKAVNNLKELNNNNNANSSQNIIQVDELVSRMNVLHDLHLPASNQVYQQTLSNLNNELNNTNNSLAAPNLQLSQLSFQQHLNISQQLSNLHDAKLSSKDNNNVNNGTFHLNIEQQQQQQQQQQRNSLNYQNKNIKDITFISLLVTMIFYKLRLMFPNLVARSEDAWKFLASFEHELDSSFLHNNFMEFLQNELLQHRLANRKRIDSLKQEVLFLEKMSKVVDKEVEQEIYRLVQMQNSKNNNNINKLPQPLINAATNNSSRTLSSQHQSASNNFLANTNPNGLLMDIHEKASMINCKGAKPCPECGKVFKNSYKLNRHLYVHKDPSEKPFVCNWDNCHYRSISKNDLNRHKMIHTGEKPFLCEIEGCEKRYSRVDKLRQHKLSAHFKYSSHNSNNSNNKREQICIWPGCNFQCSNKNELNRHTQLLHGGAMTSSTVLNKCEYGVCEKFDKVEKILRHQQQQQHRDKDHGGKIDVTLSEHPLANFSSMPISVTSTPDIPTVVATSSSSSTNNNNHSTASSLNMHHLMLTNNNENIQQQIGMPHHHGLNTTTVDNEKITNANPNTSDLTSHISLADVVSSGTAGGGGGNSSSTNGGGNDHHHQNLNNNPNNTNNNNNVISTISSVPISVVASSSNHRQNTISVWSS